jgi:hypothetical protein
MTLERVNGTLLDKDEVAACFPDDDDPELIIVVLKSGAKLFFKGDEAREVWRFLNPELDWRGER